MKCVIPVSTFLNQNAIKVFGNLANTGGATNDNQFGKYCSRKVVLRLL